MGWLLKRRWLRPEQKWAPLSLNKLTHEAFRVAGRKLAAQSEALKEQLLQGSTPLGLARSIASEWEAYAVTLEWHAHQEDCIMFREIDAFNPMATRDGYLQHAELEKFEHKLNAAAEAICMASEWNSKVAAAAQTMVDQLPLYVPFMDKHMDWEEENLLAMNRRTFNIDIQVRIVRKIWDAYEAKSVEEFRATLRSAPGTDDVDGGYTTSRKDPSKWESYKLAEFRQRARYGYPSPEGDVESLLRFPPAFPD